MKRLNKGGLIDCVSLVEPERASPESDITLVHPPSYIKSVEAMSKRGFARIDMDTSVSSATFEAALHAASATIEAVDAVLSGEADNAFCAVRPPGHHAVIGSGMGFCIFNNISIAARHAKRKYGLDRILIFDWDAHHGNGVQEVFYDDPDVLYVSIHQYPHFPGSGLSSELGIGRGAGFTINFPFPPGTGDAPYDTVMDNILKPICKEFRPQLVLVSAGYDAHFQDLLCSMCLDARSFARFTHKIMEIADEFCDGKLVLTLEGGYDFDAISASIYNTISELSGACLYEKDALSGPSPRSNERAFSVIEDTLRLVSGYWKSL